MSAAPGLEARGPAMMVVLREGASAEERAAVEHFLSELGGTGDCAPTCLRSGAEEIYTVPSEQLSAAGYALLRALPAVARVVSLASPYVLASRAYRPVKTVVAVGSVRVGAGEPIIIAGPCSVEGEEHSTNINRRFELALASAGQLSRRYHNYCAPR